MLACFESPYLPCQTNGDWQKKIAALMLTQQKTREEARTEHGGRGVEKEVTPVHESEKHYAESLAAIVSCRERLKEQQVKRFLWGVLTPSSVGPLRVFLGSSEYCRGCGWRTWGILNAFF